MRPYSEASSSSCRAAPTVRMRANTSKPSKVQPRLDAINAFHCVQSSEWYHRAARPALNSLIPHSLICRRAGFYCACIVAQETNWPQPAQTYSRLWDDRKKQKDRENGEMDDALKHGGPASAQRDDACEKGQR